MAIKAIINNTEKEIEQIKNSNEQDVDYVYSRIGDTEVEGEPPISIKSIGGNLADYRIYGNTDDGKSVGNRTANLFDKTKFIQTNIVAQNDLVLADDPYTISTILPCNPNTKYTISKIVTNRFVIWGCTDYPRKDAYCNKRIISDNDSSSLTFKTGNDDNYLLIMFFYQRQPTDPTIEDVKGSLMFNYGAALSYEPYGYKVPVTVSNGTYTQTTPIYLPEQIRKVGDEAEYVDYGAQKMHRVRKNLFPVDATSKTINGITFTVNADKSVTCNGTNNGTTSIFEFNPSGVLLEIGESYIVTGCPEGGKIFGGYIIQYNNGASWSDEIGHGATFTVSGSGVVRLLILISRGVTVDNLTFYPMIRKADIEDDTYEPYIENTDLDVTLPALSTIKGTNTFLVNTLIPPSMYIKDNFDYKRIFTATRAIEDELPLNYKNIEDNDSILSNYRIYGQTVDGESVGDRTGNLAPNLGRWVDGYLKQSDGTLMNVTSAKEKTSPFIEVNSNDEFTFSYDIGRNEKWAAVTFYDENKNFIFRSVQYTVIPFTFIVNIENAKFIRLSCNTFDSEIYPNLNSGSTALPYEPYGYKVPVTVEGKNLYKISTFRDGSTSAVVSAVTFTINNNAVSISGISSAQHPSVTSQRFELISGETYSAKIFVDGSYDGEMYIIMRGGERQDGSDEVKYKRINVGSGDTFVAKTYNSIIYVAEGTNKEFNAIVRVILIKGSMLPDTYEPYHTPITTPIYLPEQIRKVGDEAEYIDYAEQKQHRVRKNLLPNTATSQTINGVTFTVNSDGSVTCNTDENGATKTTYLAICKTPDIPESTNLILSGCPKGGSASTYALQYSTWVDVAYTDIGNGESFKKYDYETYPTTRVAIRIYVGCVCDNLTFYPMIRNADITDDTYEPYIENTDVDVTLPALPTVTGTNVLSVGTEVQPSEIYIKGKIKEIN